MGENPQFYGPWTPKTDCALKVHKDKEFYQLGFQVCWPWKHRVPATLTTEWLLWFQSSWGDSGYEKLILVLEANCIAKQPEPKSYITTDNPQNICEGVTTTTLKRWCFWQKLHGDSLTDVQWLLYLQDHGCCCIQAGVTTDVQWLLTARFWL